MDSNLVLAIFVTCLMYASYLIGRRMGFARASYLFLVWIEDRLGHTQMKALINSETDDDLRESLKTFYENNNESSKSDSPE